MGEPSHRLALGNAGGIAVVAGGITVDAGTASFFVGAIIIDGGGIAKRGVRIYALCRDTSCRDTSFGSQEKNPCKTRKWAQQLSRAQALN